MVGKLLKQTPPTTANLIPAGNIPGGDWKKLWCNRKHTIVMKAGTKMETPFAGNSMKT